MMSKVWDGQPGLDFQYVTDIFTFLFFTTSRSSMAHPTSFTVGSSSLQKYNSQGMKQSIWGYKCTDLFNHFVNHH
jgi:hypothetical protein